MGGSNFVSLDFVSVPTGMPLNSDESPGISGKASTCIRDLMQDLKRAPAIGRPGGSTGNIADRLAKASRWRCAVAIIHCERANLKLRSRHCSRSTFRRCLMRSGDGRDGTLVRDRGRAFAIQSRVMVFVVAKWLKRV